MSEIKNFHDLKGNPKNPRRISKHDFEALKNSIEKFGDLSCVVFNVRTQRLVGGHQRIQAFKALGGETRVIIETRYDAPNRVGTTAIGKIERNGELFTYREVDWDEDFENSANIAANRIQGEFDLDLLAEITYKISQATNSADLLSATGQTNDEIDRLLNMVTGEPDINLPDGDKDGFQQVTFTLSDEQAETVKEAVEHIKGSQSFEGSENSNSNGNALYYLAKYHLDRLHNPAPTQ